MREGGNTKSVRLPSTSPQTHARTGLIHRTQLQVTGPGWDQTPGALRRILHVILRVVVPYVTDKYGARLEGLTPADVLGTEGDTDADASTNGPQPSSTSSSDTQLRAQSGSQASTSSTTASPGASIVTRVRTAWRHVLRRLRPLIAFLMRFLPPLKQVLGTLCVKYYAERETYSLTLT